MIRVLFFMILALSVGCTEKKDLRVNQEFLGVPTESSNTSSYDFGGGVDIVAGSTVADKVFIFSKGTESSDSTVILDNTVDFSIVSSSGCNRLLVKTADKCQVKVRFLKSKIEQSNPYEALLTVGGYQIELSAKVGESSVSSVSLSDSGLVATEVNFGPVDSSSSVNKVLTLKNTGSVLAISVGLSGDSEFKIVSNGCGTSLAKNKSCAVRISMTAGSVLVDTQKSGILSFNGSVSYDVVGEIKAPVIVGSPLIKFYESSVEKSSIEYGPVSSGSLAKIVTLKNEGSLKYSGSWVVSGSGFSIVSNTCSSSLDINKSCSIKVALAASSGVGAKTGALSSGSFSLSLEGSVVPAGTPVCSGSEHLEGMICVSNSRACSFGNGSGTETWVSESWGSCVLNSCNNGFDLNVGSNSCNPAVRVTKISGNSDSFCAVSSSNDLKCWGPNTNTKFGLPGPSYFNPTYVLTANISSISVGGNLVCFVDNNKDMYCSGSNHNGNFGDGNPTYAATTFQKLNAVSNVSLALVSSTSCIIVGEERRVKCAGSGFLGIEGTTLSSVFVDTGITQAIKLVGSGSGSTCAVLENNNIACWGYATYIQELLWNHTDPVQRTPVVSNSLVDVKDLSLEVNGSSMCVVFNSGELKCAGWNGNGQLGTGNQTQSNVLMPTGIFNAEKYFYGNTAAVSCAILTDKTVKCWGNNNQGILGVGSNEVRLLSPTAVVGLSNVVDLVIGSSRACALTGDSKIYCWGSGYGNVPVEVPF